MRFNFEEIADIFSKELNNGITISRCDFLEITNDAILFREETDLSVKDLLKPKEYTKQVRENVKKMWGSLVFFIWYVDKECIDTNLIKNRRKIYLLDLSKARNPSQFAKTARALSNMLKELQKFKNGGIDEIKVIMPF